jgi:hypothetical protein
MLRPGTALFAVWALWALTDCTPRTKTIAEAVPETIEAVVSEAERPLRENMRPIRGATRLLVFAIDGLGRAQMAELLASGQAQHTRRLTGRRLGDSSRYEHAYLIPETLSILPSSTIAGWTTLFTGEPPAASGIPGNEFFDRESESFYAIAPTSVSSRLHALQAMNEGLLNGLIEVPTLYERSGLRAHVSLSQVYRGADLYTKSEAPFLELLVREAVAAGAEEADQSPYAAIDEDSFDSIQDGWEQYGLPDIQIVYLPGLDLYSHVTQDSLRKQLDYYEQVIEPLVAKIVAEYERRGVLADTWIMFVSDHGHTPVIADAAHALETDDLEDAFASVGYDLRPAELNVDDEDFTAVLASQGGLAYVYLANRAECEEGVFCRWQQRPRWDEDVRPVAEMLDRLNQEPVGLGGKIAAVLTRDPRDPEAPFRVWEKGRLHDVDAWLAANDVGHLVEFERRLRELTDGPQGGKVGEIILVPHYGMRYPESERYYFAQPTTSEHGSATVEDSRFTWLVVHSRMDGAEIQRMVESVVSGAARQQHFLPLVLHALEAAPSTADARTP